MNDGEHQLYSLLYYLLILHTYVYILAILKVTYDQRILKNNITEKMKKVNKKNLKDKILP